MARDAQISSHSAPAEACQGQRPDGDEEGVLGNDEQRTELPDQQHAHGANQGGDTNPGGREPGLPEAPGAGQEEVEGQERNQVAVAVLRQLPEPLHLDEAVPEQGGDEEEDEQEDSTPENGAFQGDDALGGVGGIHDQLLELYDWLRQSDPPGFTNLDAFFPHAPGETGESRNAAQPDRLLQDAVQPLQIGLTPGHGRPLHPPGQNVEGPAHSLANGDRG